MAHLTHKLPWSSIPAAIKRDPEWRRRHKDERVEFDKKVAHFVGVLSTTVAEFARTDTRSDEDKAPYDVLQWDDAYYPVYMLASDVVGTYVALNLLVEDEARMRPVVVGQRGKSLQQPAGHCDNGHPEYFADLLLPLLDNRYVREDGRYSRYEVKRLTPEVLDGIRKYCAELFKIVYTRPDEFTRERVASGLSWRFDHVFKAVGETERQ